uniref:Peptidase S1 domain-containing protein n=1 Tax=Anopheles dirus TaxID=7168 RepID=A0A182N3I3_9DIPT
MGERWWIVRKQAAVVALIACTFLAGTVQASNIKSYTECDSNKGFCVGSGQCSVRTFRLRSNRCPTFEEVCCPKSSVVDTSKPKPAVRNRSCVTSQNVAGTCLSQEDCNYKRLVGLRFSDYDNCDGSELVCCPNNTATQVSSTSTTSAPLSTAATSTETASDPTLNTTTTTQRTEDLSSSTEDADPPKCTTANNGKGYCLLQETCDSNALIDLRSASCVNPKLICCPEGSEKQTGALDTTTEVGSSGPSKSSVTERSTASPSTAHTTAPVEESTTNVNNVGISSSTTSSTGRPRDAQPPKTPNKLLPAFESESEVSEEKCGKRNLNGVGVQKINKEFLAEYGEFPWMVALFSHPEAQFCCNGALVGERAILTTAHCVSLCRNSTRNILARVGEWDMSKTEAMPIPPENIITSSAHLHKKYNPSSHVNNIALLELDHPVRYRATVQPVCLPSADYEVRSSENLIATGWGATLKQQQMISPVLKRLDLQNVHWETCKSQLKRYQGKHSFALDNSFVCAVSNHPENERPCDGDAGSPVVIEIPGKTEQYYLHGMVSWGYNCHQKAISHTALIKVLHYLDWINETMDKFH